MDPIVAYARSEEEESSIEEALDNAGVAYTMTLEGAPDDASDHAVCYLARAYRVAPEDVVRATVILSVSEGPVWAGGEPKPVQRASRPHRSFPFASLRVRMTGGVFSDPLIQRMAAFLESVGIPVIAASSLLPANFPGLDIQNGCVLVDETRVIYPGDILHEAGHVAMSAPAARGALRVTPTGGEELSTLAWSYAAARHLGLSANVVFYPESYAQLGDTLAESFAAGNYVGVPLMQALGMAVEPKNAAARGAEPFPHMLRWLR